MSNKAGPKNSKLRFRESLPNLLLDALNLLGPHQPPLDPSANAVEQLEPILQWRLFEFLPFIEATLAPVKTPLVAYPMGVNLTFLTFIVRADPANFAFGHGSNV